MPAIQIKAFGHSLKPLFTIIVFIKFIYCLCFGQIRGTSWSYVHRLNWWSSSGLLSFTPLHSLHLFVWVLYCRQLRRTQLKPFKEQWPSARSSSLTTQPEFPQRARTVWTSTGRPTSANFTKWNSDYILPSFLLASVSAYAVEYLWFSICLTHMARIEILSK